MSGTAAPLASARASTPPPSESRAPTRAEKAIDDVERRWPWALAILLLLDAVLLLYMGKGLTFFYDEWDFVQHDYGGGVHALLASHGGNISVFPVVAYKVLFHVAGLNHYFVFRLAVILLHLLACGLIFILASRRVARVPALLAMSLILFLGAAWEDLLWAFQIGYMLSIVGGLAAWVLLEREHRLGDLAALLCLILAVGSSSLGIAITIGVAVELAWQRQWRRGWIVAVPAALYLLWYLGYGESQITEESLIAAPGFAQDLAAAAFGGLVGRALDWGRPLAVLGTLVLLWRLLRPGPTSPRLAGLIAAGVSLWIVTALARSTISPPETSRYLYLGAVVIVLAGVELLRGVSIAPRAAALATVLTVSFAITGLTVLHAGAGGLSSTSETLKAKLGAIELAAAYAPAGYHPDPHLAPTLEVGPYLHTVRAIGSSPADSPAQIAAAAPDLRAAADSILVAVEVPALQAAARPIPAPSAPSPKLSSVRGGVATSHAGCVQFAPRVADASMEMLTSPGTRFLLRAAPGAPVRVALRRFADSSAPTSRTLAGASSAVLSFTSDRDPARPWYVELFATQRLEVCRG